jgi:hypothetical protein
MSNYLAFKGFRPNLYKDPFVLFKRSYFNPT